MLLDLGLRKRRYGLVGETDRRKFQQARRRLADNSVAVNYNSKTARVFYCQS